MEYQLLHLLILQAQIIQQYEEDYTILNQAFDTTFNTNLKLLRNYHNLSAKHLALMDKMDELRKNYNPVSVKTE